MNWLDWTEWTPCSVDCEGGEQRRERKCANCPEEQTGVQQQVRKMEQLCKNE